MNEEAPEVRRSCYDCGWLKAYVSWWCTNPEARKARGSAIPGIYHCPYWKGDKEFMEECRRKWKGDRSAIHGFKAWLRRNTIEIYFIAMILACALVLWLGLYLQYSK